MAVYGPVRHQINNMDLRSFGPYNIFLVTDRSIYCHMTLSAMNYLLFSLYGNITECNSNHNTTSPCIYNVIIIYR